MSRFINYGQQNITKEDITAVVKILKSPFLTQGPAVSRFEESLASKIGCKHCIAVNSATSALHLACLAIGIQKDDIIWTSPNTFVASANCGIYCGADVDFVDIEAETGLMCTIALEKKLREAKILGKLPKAIIPVHLCGNICNMSEIARLSTIYGFKVIEDASHALGATYKGKQVGNGEYSEVTVFSFHPVKIITTGEGGMLAVNKEYLKDRIKLLRSHGITKDIDSFERKNAPEWWYEQQELGFNFRMTDIQAALGISQLRRLDEIINKRRNLFELYKYNFRNAPVKLLKENEECKSSVHLAVIRLKDTSEDLHRYIFTKLRQEGIGVQLHYMPVHLQPYYKKRGFKEGDFPKAEAYAKNAMSLPMYPELTKDEIKYISDNVKQLIES